MMKYRYYFKRGGGRKMEPKETIEPKLHIGDKLFRVGRDGIDEVRIIRVDSYPTHCVYKDDHGHSYFDHTINKSCFKTLEEAEKEVQKRQNILKKRKLLKEYEIQLNYEMGIENHFIVK